MQIKNKFHMLTAIALAAAAWAYAKIYTPVVLAAAIDVPDGDVLLAPNTTTQTIPWIINKVINFAVVALGGIAVIMIIFGGFKIVMSGGDSKAAETGKNIITWTVVGVIVMGLAAAIVKFALNFIGL